MNPSKGRTQHDNKDRKQVKRSHQSHHISPEFTPTVHPVLCFATVLYRPISPMSCMHRVYFTAHGTAMSWLNDYSIQPDIPRFDLNAVFTYMFCRHCVISTTMNETNSRWPSVTGPLSPVESPTPSHPHPPTPTPTPTPGMTLMWRKGNVPMFEWINSFWPSDSKWQHGSKLAQRIIIDIASLFAYFQ